MSQRIIPACLVLVTLSLFAFAATAGDTARTVTADPPIDVTHLDSKAAWKQVNEKPYYVTSVVNVLCAAPTTARVEDERKRNPHASTAITVFVNEIGREAMFSAIPVTFPAGSVIVKQKFDPKDQPEKPLLYTVMIKRDHGFNPDSGDWEFAVVSGDGREIQARGNIENCAACHKPQAASDFVFRSYLGH